MTPGNGPTAGPLDRRRLAGMPDRRRLAGILVSLLLLLLAAGPAPAQEPAPPDDADRDAAIFGASDEEPAGGDADPADADDTARDDAIFGTADEPATVDPILTKEDLLALEEDILQIGGQLYLRFAYSARQEQGVEDHPFSMPNLLDVYLDARPTDRIRGYVRGRLSYDPTREGVEGDPLMGDLAPTPDNPDVLLDQLWLKFDVARAVFLTIGKQPARWGTGRLWNPLDFLQDRHRDPLTFFDERTGVSLVKVHVPVEALAWNFYAVAILDGAASVDRVGVAGRGEFVVGTAELALSAKYRQDTAPRFGFDFSAGVWDLDIYGEVAISLGTDAPTYEGDFVLESDPETGAIVVDSLRLPTPVEHGRDEVIPQVVAGVEYGIQVSDEDVLYAGAEYFYNHLGYGDRDLYPFLLLNGAMEFFYTGRHYGALYFLLPNPGSWEDTTFGLSAVGNFSDETFLTRFDFSVTILTWMRLETYVAAHFGTRGGELRFALDLPGIEIPEGVDLGDLPIEPGTEIPPTNIPPTIIDFGLNLRVAI